MSETVQTRPDRENESTWKRWLPWLVLTAIILVVAWLIWLYADWRTPAGSGTRQVTGASVRVPDVVGLDADDARQVLEDAKLTWQEDVSYDQYAEPGTVSSQSPPGGSRVAPGAIVVIDVVSGEGEPAESEDEEPDYNGQARGLTGRDPTPTRMVRVPDLLGLSEDAAQAAVESRGLLARPMYQPRSKNLNTVVQQDPPAGELTPAGSQVHYLIFVAR